MLATSDVSLWFKLSVALRLGSLVGAEHKWRKGADKHRSAAGIRTFALGALVGPVAVIVCDGGSPAYRWRLLPGLLLVMAAVRPSALVTLP